MKGLKTFLIAILCFIFGSGTSAYFVSNVAKMKASRQNVADKNRLEISLQNIEFDDTGLEGVDYLDVSIYDKDKVIAALWPVHENALEVIMEEGLKKQGLRIAEGMRDEKGQIIVPDFLRLNIYALADAPGGFIAGNVGLVLNGAFVNYKTTKFVNADSWHRAEAFMFKENEAAAGLQEITRRLMDDFIKDYLKANPKADI